MRSQLGKLGWQWEASGPDLSCSLWGGDNMECMSFPSVTHKWWWVHPLPRAEDGLGRQ